MLEAYAVGVSLTLKGNIAEEIRGVASQFEGLNRTIRDVQTGVNQLAAGMRGLGRIARESASAWKDAAAAMERAARAAGRAQGGMGGGYGDNIAQGRWRAPPYSPDFTTEAGPRGGASAYRGRGAGGALVPYRAPGMPEVWINPNTGFSTDTGPAGGASRRRGGRGLVPYYASPEFSMPGSRGDLGAWVPPGTFPGGPGTGPTGTDLAMVPEGARGGDPFGGMWNGFSYPGGPMPAFPTHAVATVGAVSGAAAYGLFGFLKDMFEARVKVDQELYRLGQQQFSPSQVQAAEALAFKMQQDIPGTSVGGNLHVMRDLTTITQNPAEAMASAPKFAKLGLFLASLGMGDQTAELYAAMQSAELRGTFNDHGKLSLDKMGMFLDYMAMTTQRTGGRIGPKEILQTLKSSGVAGANVTEDTLFTDLNASMLAMGTARAGTGLQGFVRQFAGGRMSEAAAKMLIEAGEIDTHGLSVKAFIKKYHAGMGYMNMPPEYMAQAMLAARMPADFILQRLVPAADRYNAKHGGVGDTDDDKLLRRQLTLMRWGSSIPGGAFSAEQLRSILLLGRDREAAGKLKAEYDDLRKRGIDPLDAAQKSPNVQMAAFQASLNALMVAMGGPGVPMVLGAMKDLVTGLNAIANWAKANPGTAKFLLETTAVLTGLSAAAALFSGAAVAGKAFIDLRTYLVGIGAAEGAPAAAKGLGMLAGSLSGLIALFGTASLIHAGVETGADWLRRKLFPKEERAHDAIEEADEAVGFKWMHPSTWSGADARVRAYLHQHHPEMFGPGAGATVQRQSYTVPAHHAAPITNIVYVTVDGQVVSRSVTRHQTRAAARPSAGPTGFNLGLGLPVAGVLT